MQPEWQEGVRPRRFTSLASKFSVFTGLLLFWVVLVIIGYDAHNHRFELGKGLVLLGAVALVAGALARFTISLLARPLALLQEGMRSVQQGRLEPIQVSRTADEIEYLGESFNKMIETLAASKDEIRQHQELLEDRIRQRTEALEQATHKALTASYAKSEFLANISHELRTPMNGLLGMVDIVLESRLSPDQREQLETARRCAYSLLALLNDILDLSKIEAGKMILEKIPFDLRSVVLDCVKAQTANASSRGISLVAKVDETIPVQVIGDPLRLRQIVANLVSNAVKFTDRGSVRVLVEQADRGGTPAMRIDVVDTGTGIAQDKLAAIFEKFTQADGSVSRKYGGTGLGLAITRRLVDIHGGEITVKSELGRGSTFTVLLPLEIVTHPEHLEPAHAQPAAFSNSTTITEQRRILVVEDNLVNQKVVTAVLKKKNLRIEIAGDGRQALDLLNAEGDDPFSLVLMDVQMPVLDGLEATRLIRNDGRWERLPIIAMTAHAMNGDRERCLQAGMNDYLSKPVQPAHLLATVDRYLREETKRSSVETDTSALAPADPELVNDALAVFLQLAPERMERLEIATRSGDAGVIAQEARKIAVAADRVQAPALRACARIIESAAAEGDFDQISRQLLTLDEEIRALHRHSSLKPV
jgi:signal transduction histidine kinase/CheY-like chemotaxis protein/HPt (histidine-containing phosphotransfer) domain-containing protein